MSPRKKPARKLSKQEAALWALVTKDVAQLNKIEQPVSMEQLMAGTAPPTWEANASPTIRPTSEKQRKLKTYNRDKSLGSKQSMDSVSAKLSDHERSINKNNTYTAHNTPKIILPNPPQQSVSVFTQGDPAMERRVARGRMRIDACLDLHGHTQVEAQQRLQAFIALARHQEARCVLVITGKGRESQRTRMHDDRLEDSCYKGLGDMHRAPRGVLRSRFLDWVEQAPLRDHIIRVSGAKPRDGGTGAFYVFLKKR